MYSLENRFKSHDVTEEQVNQMKAIRDECYNLAFLINVEVPESREKSLALTKLEEVMFWANAGISRQ